MCGRTRLEFNNSGTKNRTDAAYTNRLNNVHRKDEWVNSSTSVLHGGKLTTASHVCSRRRPFEKNNRNVCTSQLYIVRARRLLQTVIHTGHSSPSARSTHVSADNTGKCDVGLHWSQVKTRLGTHATRPDAINTHWQ